VRDDRPTTTKNRSGTGESFCHLLPFPCHQRASQPGGGVLADLAPTERRSLCSLSRVLWRGCFSSPPNSRHLSPQTSAPAAAVTSTRATVQERGDLLEPEAGWCCRVAVYENSATI